MSFHVFAYVNARDMKIAYIECEIFIGGNSVLNWLRESEKSTYLWEKNHEFKVYQLVSI